MEQFIYIGRFKITFSYVDINRIQIIQVYDGYLDVEEPVNKEVLTGQGFFKILEYYNNLG